MYLHLMGAKVAPSKSYIVSSNSVTDTWLKEHMWQFLPVGNQFIQVLKSVRDLGANISTGAGALSGTMVERFKCSIMMAF